MSDSELERQDQQQPPEQTETAEANSDGSLESEAPEILEQDTQAGAEQERSEQLDEEDAPPLLDREMTEEILLALLFVNEDPVPLDKLLPVFEEETETPPPKKQEDLNAFRKRLANEIQGVLQDLEARLQDQHGPLQIAEVAGGYQLCTKPEYASYIDRFFERRKKGGLSGAALETLAIIAYRQPVTRAELEAMRGVNVDYIVHSLLEKRLIRISGRKDVIGRPFLYKTTKFFLEYFGLSSLKELPKSEELREAFDRGEDKRENMPEMPIDEQETEPRDDSAAENSQQQNEEQCAESEDAQDQSAEDTNTEDENVQS